MIYKINKYKEILSKRKDFAINEILLQNLNFPSSPFISCQCIKEILKFLDFLHFGKSLFLYIHFFVFRDTHITNPSTNGDLADFLTSLANMKLKKANGLQCAL